MTHSFSRRDLFAASAASAVGWPSRSDARTDPTPLARGFDSFTDYFRIISDLEGGSTYRFHAGKVLYVPGPRQLARDFVDYVSIKQDRSRRLENGDFQHGYKGVTLFVDPDSGAVLETFLNPVTEETVTVEHFATSGGSIVYTPEGPYTLRPGESATDRKSVRGKPVEFDWNAVGDDVWLTYPERFAIYDDEGRTISADNSMYRYHASLAQLRNYNLSSIDTVMSWQTETGPWAWMGMSGLPGHFIFGGLGRKYGSVNDLPIGYVEAIETRYSGYLSEPIEWSRFAIQ